MATQEELYRQRAEEIKNSNMDLPAKVQALARLTKAYESQQGNQNLGSAAPAAKQEMGGLLNDLANSGMSGQSSGPSRGFDPGGLPPPQYSAGSALSGGTRLPTQGGPGSPPVLAGGIQNGAALAQSLRDRFPQQQPTQAPGNNLTNPGYTEQGFDYIQNRLLEDPAQAFLTNAAQSTQTPSVGEQYMNQNLGSLDGPGYGEQYWNQVQGQFQDPFAGEQFARQATQNFNAQGPASAFYNDAMSQYGDAYMGYNTQNAQNQYGQTSAALANGTRGEQGLGQIAGDYGSKGTYSGQNNAANQYAASQADMAGGLAGERGLGDLAAQYGSIGQYQGGNNALSQYQQNASSGPMAAQQFYDQVGGQYGTMGQYNDTNRAAGQYEQTQQAFGDLPIANFDPFFDRAIQLGTQQYNQGAAGRGVYGSSEALNGVGNIITDLNAQRALKGFDAEMQRAVEQRNRQQLLGEQARAGDLSSLAAFGANLSGLETFGNLANQAGNQTLQQQTMLGNQARSADQTALDAFNSNLRGVDTFANVNNMQGQLQLGRNNALADMARNSDLSATDAFRANLEGATTFANINNQLANQELGRYELLGNQANAADSQATAAQNARTSALNAFAGAAQSADAAETNRYQASTNAMNAADQTQLDRLRTGGSMANDVDAGRRSDYEASMGQARNAAQLGMDRTRLGADLMNTASQNDMQRLNSFMQNAGIAEGDRQQRMQKTIDAISGYSQDVQQAIMGALGQGISAGQADWENSVQAELAPVLQQAGLSRDRAQQLVDTLTAIYKSRK
jgi:hypothetical protein